MTARSERIQIKEGFFLFFFFCPGACVFVGAFLFYLFSLHDCCL